MEFWWLEVIGGIESKRRKSVRSMRQCIISFPSFFRNRVRNHHTYIFRKRVLEPAQVHEQDGDLSINPANMRRFVLWLRWKISTKARSATSHDICYAETEQNYCLYRFEPLLPGDSLFAWTGSSHVWTTCSHYVFTCVQAAGTGYQVINMEAWHSNLSLTWQL